MSIVAAKRRSDGLRLDVDAGSALITGSASSIQVAHREALFSYLLVAAAPEALKYSTIEAQVLHPYGIGMPPSDPMAYIRKLKLSADKAISVATGEGGLIVTVRGLGYRLMGNWQLDFPRSQREVEAAIRRIQELAAECVSLMRNTPLVGDDGGLFVLDPSAHDNSVSAITTKFQAFAQDLLNAARLNSRPSKVEAYEPVLADIYSYFAFRRQGQVDEAIWRRLFERELMQKIDLLVRLL